MKSWYVELHITDEISDKVNQWESDYGKDGEELLLELLNDYFKKDDFNPKVITDRSLNLTNEEDIKLIQKFTWTPEQSKSSMEYRKKARERE